MRTVFLWRYYFADKVCVDEELVRLRSHIETTKKTLGEGGSIGKEA